MFDGVSVQLNVSVKGRHVLAALEFRNMTQLNFSIEKFNACTDGQIENNVFEIRTNGRLLEYTGLLAKRRRALLEDYIVIPAGRTFRTKADLTAAYDFPHEMRTYEALYSATLSYPDRDGLWTLNSNSQRFRFQHQ